MLLVYTVYAVAAIFTGLQDGLYRVHGRELANDKHYWPYFIIALLMMAWSYVFVFAGPSAYTIYGYDPNMWFVIPVAILKLVAYGYIISNYYDKWPLPHHISGLPFLLVLSFIIGLLYGLPMIPMMIILPVAALDYVCLSRGTPIRDESVKSTEYNIICAIAVIVNLVVPCVFVILHESPYMNYGIYELLKSMTS